MKLAIGDRVKVYDYEHSSTPMICTITNPEDEAGIVYVKEYFDNTQLLVFAKQCRKLVKKVRREWWIRECVAGKGHGWSLMIAPEKECELCEVIRVREVKEKK